jgi:hypothetical protein
LADWNMVAGWTGMFLGLLAGASIGLFFHQESFAGGYASFRRRLMRLGHVAFFGLGILNVLYALTLDFMAVELRFPVLASSSLIAGAVLMPLVCFLSAWRRAFRHLFALPVIFVAISLWLLIEGLLL